MRTLVQSAKNSAESSTIKFRRSVGLAILPMFLSACGGGEGDVNTGAQTTAAAQSVVTQGVVSKMQPLTVSNREFDVGSHTSINTNRTITPGMRVTVQSTNSVASSVTYLESVKGPVDWVNGSTLGVMGQTVTITDETTLDGELSSLREGDIVEVSGLTNENGVIEASYGYLLQSTSASAYSVQGSVANLDRGALTFSVNALSVDYSQASLYTNAGELANGAYVYIADRNRDYVAGSGQLSATDIDILQSTDIHQDDDSSTDGESTGAEHEIEAIITERHSDNLYTAGSVTFRVDSNTQYRHGDQSDLSVGTRVEVEGELLNNGELLAREVEFHLHSSGYHNATWSYTYSHNHDDYSSGGGGSGSIEYSGTATHSDSESDSHDASGEHDYEWAHDTDTDSDSDDHSYSTSGSGEYQYAHQSTSSSDTDTDDHNYSSSGQYEHEVTHDDEDDDSNSGSGSYDYTGSSSNAHDDEEDDHSYSSNGQYDYEVTHDSDQDDDSNGASGSSSGSVNYTSSGTHDDDDDHNSSGSITWSTNWTAEYDWDNDWDWDSWDHNYNGSWNWNSSSSLEVTGVAEAVNLDDGMAIIGGKLVRFDSSTTFRLQDGSHVGTADEFFRHVQAEETQLRVKWSSSSDQHNGKASEISIQ